MAKKASGIFNKIRLTESYTSLILGAIVVLIIGILFISFAKENKSKQISSTDDVSKISEQLSQSTNTSSTYTVKPGDDLWTISENIYNNGYRWVEIAKLNKLENPGLIYSGDKLTIPANEIVKNNSITGNRYVVIKGDSLWNIAVRAYGDGFRWTQIAKTNNIVNPNLIHPGNVLKIPR